MTLKCGDLPLCFGLNMYVSEGDFICGVSGDCVFDSGGLIAGLWFRLVYGAEAGSGGRTKPEEALAMQAI